MHRPNEVFDLPALAHPLKAKFMRWQCRVRQISMREYAGKPDSGIIASVKSAIDGETLGSIITVMNKAMAHSRTPELKHMYLQTHDPAKRREKALQFFSGTYYQKHQTFSDIFTATFMAGSAWAQKLAEEDRCQLIFEAYNRHFELVCRTEALNSSHPFHQATRWHNLLFNPNLDPNTVILGFKPEWEQSHAY